MKQDRIQINGVWYVREQSREEIDIIDNVIGSESRVFESNDFSFEAVRMKRTADGNEFYDGIDMQFTDKREDRPNWIEEYWDNDAWLIGVYLNKPDSLKELTQYNLGDSGLKELQAFIGYLIDIQWLKLEN